jgi:hypothetical protein
MKDFESLEKIKPKYEVLLSDAMDEAYNMGYNKGWDDGYDKGFRDGQVSNPDIFISGIREQGREESWLTIKEIMLPTSEGGIDWEILLNIFDCCEKVEDILQKYSASEAIDKITEYKSNQKREDKLEVGDEVIIKRITYKGKAVVTKIDENHHCAYIMFNDGEVNTLNLYDYEIRKTGKRYFSITAILDSLKEVEDGETKQSNS